MIFPLIYHSKVLSLDVQIPFPNFKFYNDLKSKSINSKNLVVVKNRIFNLLYYN